MEIRIRIGGRNRYEPNPNEAPPAWRDLPEAKAFAAAVERRDKAVMAVAEADDDHRDEMKMLAIRALEEWSRAGSRLYSIPFPRFRESFARALPALLWVAAMLAVPTVYRIVTGAHAGIWHYLPGVVALVLFLKTSRYRTERIIARLLARNAEKARAEEADKAAAEIQRAGVEED